jgi:hypothetical protein
VRLPHAHGEPAQLDAQKAPLHERY